MPRSLLSDDEPDFKPTYFLQTAGFWTGGSIIGGLGIGLLSLLLFKHKPHAMVGLSVGLQVGIPAAVGIALLAAGAGGGAIAPLLFAGILAWVFYLYREQLALVGRLLSIGARTLSQNPGMVVVALLVQIGSLVLMLPFVAFLFLAFTNGHVAPNASVTHISQEGICKADDGSEVMCCAWVPDGWAIAYMAWTSLALSWTMLLMFTIQLYIISGATAQWYFAPVNGPKPKGMLMRNTRHALGPSFGTLCCASWLLALIRTIRSMLDQARRDNNGNLCMALLISCLDVIYQILEQFTKFGVVRAAITGEAFMPACRAAVSLLTRNLLDTVGVWWFPGMILQVTAFILSGTWGLGAFGASYAYWGRNNVAMSSAIAVGVVAFFFAFVTLGFINSVLLSIVDAVYLCFAMDRDAHACTRIEVHEVYAQLPSCKSGGIIEQPDGNYAYGQSSPHAPQPYPSPMAQPGMAGYGEQAYHAPGQVGGPSGAYPHVPRV